MQNILNLDLEMPNRTTIDYEGPTQEPQIQSAIESALQDDPEDIHVQSE